MKQLLAAQREKNGVYLPSADFDNMQATMSAQADRIKVTDKPASYAD